MKIIKNHLSFGFALFCTFFGGTFFNASLSFALDVPRLTGPVVDLANVLTSEETRLLDASLRKYQSANTAQIQVLILPSLKGESIESYSIKVVDQWKLGSAKKDNGVLLLVSIQDRQIRIEVGQGLEGEIPDITAGHIIRDDIVPYFKKGQFGSGVISGVQAIVSKLGGTLEGAPVIQDRQDNAPHGIAPGVFNILILLFVIFFVVLPKLGFRHRRGLGGGHWRSGGGGWGGGFGGGGFGGGSWGGGGGGFSGGGASGRW